MEKTKIDKIIKEAFEINEDKQMLPEELEIVSRLWLQYYTGGNTLEIGAYKGMTSYVFCGLMANSVIRKPTAYHHIVDVFDETQDMVWNYQKHPQELLEKNLGDYRNMAIVHKGTSLSFEVLQALFENKYDFVFIDGDHRYPVILLELLMCDILTNHITGHDYGHNGVTRSVNEFLKITGYDVKRLNGKFGLFEIIK